MTDTKRLERTISRVLWLVVFEGLLAEYFLFRIPSMGRNQTYFGYSTARIVLAGGFLLMLSCIATLALLYRAKPRVSAAVLGLSVRLMEDEVAYHCGLLLLGLSGAIGLSAVIFFGLDVLPEGNFHRAVFLRARSLVVWFTLVCLQIAGIMWLFRRFPSRNLGGYGKRISSPVFVGLLGYVTLIQWAILVFRIPIFTSIPNWYWHYFDRMLEHGGLILLLLLISAGVSAFVLTKERPSAVTIPLAMFMGYILQVGFGFVEGQGFNALQQRLLEAGRPQYAQVVADSDFKIEDLLSGEFEGSGDYFIRTKPPGYLLPYALLQEWS